MEKSTSTMATPRTNHPKSRWSRITVFVFVIACLAAVALWAYPDWSEKQLTIVVDQQSEMTVTVRARTVADVLTHAGIELAEGDEVYPPLNEKVQDGDRIEVILAEVVTVAVDGDEIRVAVAAGTVQQALARAGVVMGPLDRVVPVRQTKLEEGMRIEVIRVVQEEIEEMETIPYRTVRWAEPQLQKGVERVVREGKEGILKKHVRLTYENGKLAHRQELSHEVVEEAIARIIGVGTRESVNVIETASGALRYTDVIEVEATAYYPGPRSTGVWADGYTYTGLLAGRGVVAVDPEVIPLGTRLYIPGYGEAIAADIGGAIKGYKIDLGFPTYEEAIQYGRQHGVKVYILQD